jgi:hypothetical protein
VVKATKRARRSPFDIVTIKDAIIAALKADQPMTVRQVFYRLVSGSVIAKTENEYKNTVNRLLTEMRLAREIPFGWIADNTRWMRKPDTHSGLAAIQEHAAQTYRRAVWDNQECYVEIWLEKDALAGVLMDVTDPWDVPLMVTRGYSSLSYLYEAAEAIAAEGKPAFLYYFGDYDPSGLDITRAVEARLREFAPEADITFERVAVTEEQIDAMRLPTRPTKRTDSRSKGFDRESVEVDAIPPKTLKAIAEHCITRHVDQRAYEQMKLVEAAERKTLEAIAAADWSSRTEGYLDEE